MMIGPRPPHVALVLDTDVLTGWRAGRSAITRAISAYISVTKVPPALTSTTVFEMLHGFEKDTFIKSGMGSERTKYDKEHARILTRDCIVLPFNERAAEIAAYIFPRLSKAKRNALWADMFIAATAAAHDHGVATSNQTDFELIGQHMPPDCSAFHIAIWKPESRR